METMSGASLDRRSVIHGSSVCSSIRKTFLCQSAAKEAIVRRSRSMTQEQTDSIGASIGQSRPDYRAPHVCFLLLAHELRGAFLRGTESET
jgi:hypothetical protein